MPQCMVQNVTPVQTHARLTPIKTVLSKIATNAGVHLAILGTPEHRHAMYQVYTTDSRIY